MKRKSKSFLALFLSFTLAMTPVVSLHAEVPETPVQEAATETAVTETEIPAEEIQKEEELTDSTGKPSVLPQEQTQSEAKDGEQAGSKVPDNTDPNTPDQQEVEKPDAEQGGRVSDEKTEAADTAPEVTEPAEEKAPGQEVPDTVQTEEEKDFSIAKVTTKEEGDRVLVDIFTETEDYDRIYEGSKEDAVREPVIKGTHNELGGYTFRLNLPAEKEGQAIKIVPGNQENDTWYEKEDVFFDVPVVEEAEKNTLLAALNSPVPFAELAEGISGSAGVQVQKPDGKEFSMFSISESTAATVGDKIRISISTDNKSYGRLYLGSKEDADKTPVIEGTQKDNGGWNFSFEVPIEKKGSSIPIVLGKPDGTWYSKQDLFITIPDVQVEPEPEPEPAPEVAADGIYRVDVESSASMFRGVDCVLTSQKGTMSAVITLSGTGYDYLYMGTSAEAEKAPSSRWVPYTADSAGMYTYTVPVSSLNTAIPVAAHSIKNQKWYDRELTFKSEGIEKIGGADPESPEQNDLKDGTYKAEVESSASMFRVVDCTLTSKSGNMSAVITLSGTGYDYLYMGKAEDAARAAASDWIPYAADKNGKYTYEVPVSALDTPIAVAAHSIKNDKWYDRELTFKSEGLQPVPGENTPDDNKPGGDVTDNNKPGGNTPNDNKGGNASGENQNPPNNNTADNESEHLADLSGATGQVDNSTTLKDGVYTPDRFSWSGGTGRVSITCDKVTVTNGQAYATIVFSSDAYAYVKASGNTYYGTKGSGTTTFVIPIQLNQNNRIIGMSTKMSASHEITYDIFVYIAEAANGSKGSGDVSGQNEKLDEEAPEIMGLEYQSETKLDHAQYFKIYHYSQGITLIEIDMKEDTARGPVKSEKKSEEATSEEKTAEIYKGNIVKYLIVPENTDIPVGLDEDMILIQLPSDKGYIASEEALKFIDETGKTDQLAAVGIEKEDCTIENVVQAMESGKISFAGSGDEPDYKQILKSKCTLAVLPSEILPKKENDGKTVEEQNERFDEIAGRFALLGIPMLVDRSADEKEELAKYEWIKLYGAVYGCPEKAQELFDAAAADVK